MTKLITTKKWQCTVCGKTFSTQKDAKDCEKNKPDFILLVAFILIGTMDQLKIP